MADQAIEVTGLSKQFGEVAALQGVDLSVSRGVIYGMLGPNAAGKSTTIRLLSGIIRGSADSALILGHDLDTEGEVIKRKIGYVAQQFALYPELTVSENLAFYGSLYGVTDNRRHQRLLDQYGLAPFVGRAAGKLSGGYKRRLSIACAMVHDPDLVLLDEPTAGIDPVTRKGLWELFYALADSGKTLFVTTHYMEEAERCNRLAFLNKGKRVAEGTPLKICESLGDAVVFHSLIDFNPEITKAISRLSGVLTINQFGGQLRVVAESEGLKQGLEMILARHLETIPPLAVVAPTIEDVFITLTREQTQ